MDFNALLIFVRVVQAGSFSAAGRQLNMPVSTVSTKISQLETRLGVSLLVRTTRKLQLTDAGTRYYRHALDACSAIEAAEASTSEGQAEISGLVRMTSPVEMGIHLLTDAVSDFLESNPNVQVELILTNHLVDLIGDGIDFAVRVGALEDSSLVAKRVGASNFQLYASPAYLKKHGEPRKPEDLSKHHCLNFYGNVSDVWELTCNGESVKVGIKGPVAANNLISLHRLALEGRGVSLLPRYLSSEAVTQGKLKHILKGCTSDRFIVHLVHPHQKFVPKRVRVLMDFVAQRLHERI